MIFATVGTQLVFPRLIGALDRIAGAHGLEMIAQTCDPAPGTRHIECHQHIAPVDFDALFARAELVVGHAGIGTILTARKLGKPLLLLPRRASLGEHRNDHQMATARFVARFPGIRIAWGENELEEKILERDPPVPEFGASPERNRLIARVREFLLQD